MTSGVDSLARLSDALAERALEAIALGSGGMAIDARRVFADVDEENEVRQR